MGWGECPLTPTLSQRVLYNRVPADMRGGKGQKMADPQDASGVSQMVNEAGTRPVSTPTSRNVKIIYLLQNDLLVIMGSLMSENAIGQN